MYYIYIYIFILEALLGPRGGVCGSPLDFVADYFALSNKAPRFKHT